jgi:hypothetical protein
MEQLAKFYVEEVTADQWQQFFHIAAVKVPFVTLEWSNSVSDVFGYKVDRLGVFKETELIAGLVVYYKIKGGKKFAGHPLLTPYNTLLVKSALSPESVTDTDRALKYLEVLSSYLSRNYIYPYFLLDTTIADTRAFQWSGWNVIPGYTYLVNPQTAIPDSDVRRRAKRCSEEGFYINNDYNPHEFWTLFKSTSERQGIKKMIGKEQFSELLNPVKHFLLMFSAYDKQQQMHASWIQMSCDDATIYNWNAASDATLLKQGGTPFLASALLEEIRKRNYSTWDLCGADNPSVARFKSTLGGKLTPYFKISYSGYSIFDKVKYRFMRNFGGQ